MAADLGAFELLAECSISFAGFAAVFAALRGSRGPRGSGRAWATVAQGLQAFVYSLLPLLFSRLDVSPEAVWRLSSALALAGVLVFNVMMLRVHLGLTRHGHPAQTSVNLAFGLALPWITALILLSNLVGWPAPPGGFAYLLAAALTLCSGMPAFLVSFWLPLRDVWTGEVEE